MVTIVIDGSRAFSPARVCKLFREGMYMRLQWFKHHIVFAILLVTPLVVVAQTIKIEPPVQVSPPDSGGHFWIVGNTHAAPDDPLSLITCGMRIRANPLSWEGYLYASGDGGLTWREARVDSTQSDSGVPDLVSEVSCALGRHGTMYMNSTVWGKWHSHPFQLSHSIDGGRTWSKPLQRQHVYDAARAVVDNTGGPFDGHLYIFSNRLRISKAHDLRLNPSYEPLITSTDSGRSVKAAVAAEPSAQYLSQGWPSQAIVLNDGKAMAVHQVRFANSVQSVKGASREQAPNEMGIDVITSSDGGLSLDEPVVVSRWKRSQNTSASQSPEPAGIFNIAATLGVDRSLGPYKNRVYVAWREADSADSLSRIMLAWSDDSGKTWSKPLRVDDAARDRAGESDASLCRGTDPMVPSIVVNKDGIVGLMWMENLLTPCWRFSASLDGGATFLPSIIVYAPSAHDGQLHTQWLNNYVTAADRPSDLTMGAIPQLNKLGFTLYTQFDDTSALTATGDGVFHPIWITRGDGAVWTARIEVNRKTAAKPALSIVGLSEVTKRVRLEPRNFHYDVDSGRVFVDVVLLNTSLGEPDREPRFESLSGNKAPSVLSDIESKKRPLVSPLIIRINSMESEVGKLELVNFDGIDSDGAPLLDWSDALPPGGLMPGGRTRSRRLEFRLSSLKTGTNPDVMRVANVAAEAFSK